MGLRLDDYRGIGQHVSPRLAVIKQINDVHTVKLLYGEAFRAPGINETDLINNPVQLGNPDLQPETVKTWELIWLAEWKHTALHLGYFDNQFADSIVLFPTGQGQLLRFENRAQSPSKGVEVEMSQEFAPHWLLRMSGMRLTETPQDAFREAKYMLSLMVNYQRSAWNANLSLVQHGSRQMIANNDANNLLTLDSYQQLDGRLLYAWSNTLDLHFDVNNLLDTDIRSPPQVSSLPEGIPDRGRNWRLGLVWQLPW